MSAFNTELRVSIFGDTYSSPTIRNAFEVRAELAPPNWSCDYADCDATAVYAVPSRVTADSDYLCDGCVTR